MLYVPNEMNDPRINLAIETYLLREKQIDEPILLFYINDPSIIIGRNQNTIEEINTEYVKEHDIKVVRRLSGGGAVYHDHGNLNFSFIMPDDGQSHLNFEKFTRPIINALHQMGVKDAELKGRNDLVIGDKKFSGNAMYATEGRMFAHGTILFDSNIDEVVRALKVSKEKIQSKGIQSIRSRVTNIKPYLSEEYQTMTTRDFRDALLLNIFDTEALKDEEIYELTEADWEGIDKISKELYQNWDWNYGKSPEFSMVRKKRFPIGTIEIQLNVESGTIKDAKIYGDFFGFKPVSDIEQLLVGQLYREDHLMEVFKDIDLTPYFGNISLEEFIQLVIV